MIIVKKTYKICAKPRGNDIRIHLFAELLKLLTTGIKILLWQEHSLKFIFR